MNHITTEFKRNDARIRAEFTINDKGKKHGRYLEFLFKQSASTTSETLNSLPPTEVRSNS
jgi:hypothetical protein